MPGVQASVQHPFESGTAQTPQAQIHRINPGIRMQCAAQDGLVGATTGQQKSSLGCLKARSMKDLARQ
jgi:hypothetical protein